MPVASWPRCGRACRPSAVSAAASGWPYTPKTPHSSWSWSASNGSVVAIGDPRLDIRKMVMLRLECEWAPGLGPLASILDQPVHVASVTGFVAWRLLLTGLRRRWCRGGRKRAHCLLRLLGPFERALRVV